MRSAKKSTKVLSALSMAAMAVIGMKAGSAHGATVTLYYGDDPSYANSNNQIDIGTTYTAGGNGSDLKGGVEKLGGVVTPVVVSQTAPTTINLPIGSYLSLAIDALITGNVNADAGDTSGETAQPSYLGLAALGVGIASSDTTAASLSPLGGAKVSTANNGGTTYFSTGEVNTAANTQGQQQGANGGAATGAYNVVPYWASTVSQGDVEPNKLTGKGSDTGSTASGSIGINSPPFGGSTAVNAATPTGIQQLEAFAASTSTANATPLYTNATDFVDNLIFEGLTAGTVTLTPQLDTAATSYWVVQTHGSVGSPTVYKTKGVNTASGDVINNLPVLVINVGAASTGVGSSVVPQHAVIALSATANTANYGTTIANGTGDHNGTFTPVANSLTSTGSGGGYTLAEVTGINSGGGDATDNVGVTGIAATDAEIFGLDVKVGGSQATAAQLATLIAAINGTDGGGETASVVTGVTTADPTHGDISSLDTASTSYNLFLTFAAGFDPGSLGFDVSSTNDSNLSGYDISAVAVVPEPMSLGLLALGGAGLMSRRSRRKS